jgi:hypothetical protein
MGRKSIEERQQLVLSLRASLNNSIIKEIPEYVK